MTHPLTKPCTHCGAEKLLGEFGPHPRGREGRQACCRACYRLLRQRDTPAGRRLREARELRAEGLKRCPTCEQVKALEGGFHRNGATREGYASQCRECANAAVSLRQAGDREGANQRHKAWRDENVEHVRAVARAKQSAVRARQRGAHIDPLVVLEMDDGVCGLCHEDVDPNQFDVDHIVPLARGGEHTYGNVQATHPRCNRSKRNTVRIA